MVADTGTAAVEQVVAGDRGRASTVADCEADSEERWGDSYQHPSWRRESRRGQDEARAEQNGRAM